MQATIQTFSTCRGSNCYHLGFMKLVHILLHMVNMRGQATWIQLNFKFISLWKGCHQLLKRGRLKALVLFWWIDETLSTNLVYKSDYEIGSTTPSDEANEDHDMMMVMPWWWSSAWTWKRRERKNKKFKVKVYFVGDILFWWSRHLESVITFRFDSRTIKRGETRIEIWLSKCY